MDNQNDKGVILAADDDKEILRDLKGLFNGMGYDVLTALGKTEAVSMIDAIGFDAIILEVAMKGGIEILKRIKVKKPKAKVIVYSKCDEKTKKKAMDIGIEEFLPKGGEMSLLVDAIQRCLTSATSGHRGLVFSL